MYNKIIGTMVSALVVAIVVGSVAEAVGSGAYVIDDGSGAQPSQRLRLPGSGFGPPLGMLPYEALLLRKSAPRDELWRGALGMTMFSDPKNASIGPEPLEASGSYTGLIVDARGMGLESCMSPRILFPDGSEVWGTIFEKPEVVIDYGIVSYYKQFGDAVRNERTGANPMVVDAVSVDGTLMYNVVVSEKDGLKILSENWRSGFLDEFAIGFLKD